MLEKILETLKNKQTIQSKITQEITQEIAQEKIIKEIKSNPKITRRELALRLNKTEDSIKYHLSKLTKQGIIKHVGSTKSGEWIIIKEN